MIDIRIKNTLSSKAKSQTLACKEPLFGFSAAFKHGKGNHHDSFLTWGGILSNVAPLYWIVNSLAAQLSVWLRYSRRQECSSTANLTAELHEGFKPWESLQSKQPNLIGARQQLKEHSILAWSSNLVINQENQSRRSSECCLKNLEGFYEEAEDDWAKDHSSKTLKTVL